jgi:DNA-binding response OmpR family regulator
LRILLVEDDKQIGSFLTQSFQESGFAVDCIEDGEHALVLLQARTYHCAVVDLMLPGMDGRSLIEQIRQRGWQFPVVVLSARSAGCRAGCMEIGANDFLPKPFAFSELLARIDVLLRGLSGAVEPAQLVAGDVTLDRLSRRATRAGKLLELEPREFELLRYLMSQAGKAVSKAFLLRQLWNCPPDTDSKIIDALVSRLRQKVDDPFPVKVIRTLRGVGYLFQPAD